ncbi:MULTISPECIES: YisL family protein [Bacillus]|uniref:YisL family protein n=1 Tax=Bacillus TaxID=1386 RepID=UPI0002F4F057|nr:MULTISPECIES: YisL family protein [Bacillus]
MTHMHITTWVIAVILLIVASNLLKKGDQKAYKMTHMTLRLVYLLIILTGGLILMQLSNINGEYIGKAVLGIVVIALMELVLVNMKKGKSVKGLTVAFVIVFVLTVAMGLQLPLGLNLF